MSVGPQLIVLLQIPAGIFVGVTLYMVAVSLTVYDGFLSLFFQPILGLMFSGVAVAVLLAAGMPIRLNRRILRWWISHWWIAPALGVLALAISGLSWHPSLRVQVFDPELKQVVDSFHPVLAMTGWLLGIFSALHFYPPANWRERMSVRSHAVGTNVKRGPTK